MRLLCPPLSAIGLLALVSMASSPLVAAPPTGWKLVFNDEFEGQTLDASKWSTAMDFPGTHGPRYHNEFYLSYTLDEDVIVSDGVLRLRTEKRLVSGQEPMGLFDYSQGLVSTRDHFTFTYGYVEIRAKYPGGKGMWPCFWLMPEDENAWPPEFDIAEYYGGQHKMHHGLAYGSMRETKWDSSVDAETDFINDWHTIGLEWTAGKAVWYVDGVACKTVTADYVPGVPMYVILSNSVGAAGSAASAPDENTVFPNDFQIDYIRVYQPGQPIVKTEPPAPPVKAPALEPTKPIIAVLPAAPLP
ncbi:glycoside hydrolase family 16 [Chthoniobacter flavus Ellin428]|uniref:Glycoside hydrolase family 16 n=2 Tax=Chthoniobacter flavus TaxID=191863 RepID=B4CV93_9BACT|nr:glycoside hydrolase family 16 [Chthoniobacter flavus Ellin428]TCO89300.1 glycosyl hydrolase family 16 [Chthoniobacter flavus]